MSSTAYQTVQVHNELQLITSDVFNGQTSGQITFIYNDPVNGPQNYGQFRVLGRTSFPEVLIIDSSQMAGGSTVVRTDPTQGQYAYLGGTAKGNPYGLTVSNSNGIKTPLKITCEVPSTLKDSTGTSVGNNLGNTFIVGHRTSTSDLYAGAPTYIIPKTYVAEFRQDQLTPDELVSIYVGSSYGLGSVIGYTSATGGYVFGSDYRGYVGCDSYTNVTKALVWDMSGNCFSQANHTVTGTLTATSLSGTLTTPSQPNITSVGTLSSLGVTGTITAGTVNATTYLNLPTITPSVLPITLDTVNNRVGINQPTPTEALDVTGNILASGSVTGATLGGTLSTASQPNITSVGTLSSLDVTGTVAAGTVNATTYLNLPTITPSVFPMTLDTVNNRVGVNKTVPTRTMDIVGTLACSGNSFVGGDLDVTGNAVVHGDVDATGHFVTADHINGGVITGTSLVGPLATAAQPNITSVGTLSSLGVTGTITAGTVSATTLGGTLSTAAQTNITSVGTLSSLAVSGNVNIGTPLAASGSGTPEGVKTAPVGSIYMRTDGSSGTSFYVKESGSGNTGWIAYSAGTIPTPSVVTATLSASFTTTANTSQNLVSMSLSSGTWLVTASVCSSATSYYIGIQTTSTGTDNDINSNNRRIVVPNTTANNVSQLSHVLILSSTTTIYLVGMATSAGLYWRGNNEANAWYKNTGMRAVRLGPN
jgi:hypothetical protein